MTWAVAIKWIMLVSGVLTCTMLSAAIAPQKALTSTFGATLDGPVADIVVRSWGALVGLMGAMLIYGAFHPAVRNLALVVAGLSKVVFIGLLLTIGKPFLGRAGLPLGVDLVMVTLFLWYLLSTRRATVRA